MKKIIGIIFLMVITINGYALEIEGLDFLGLSEVISEKENESSTNNYNLENKIEFNGEFDVSLKFNKNDDNTMLYKLKLDKNLIEEYTYQNSLGLNLNAEYSFEKFEFILRTYSNYINDDNSSFNLYEAYLTFSPNYNFYYQVGKSSIYWGKGYAFNPIGVINPIKDPDDPENSGEGKNMLNLEYTKSYSKGIIQNFTGNLVLLFENNDTENGLGEIENIATAFKSYFLVMDSDLDFVFYNGNDQKSVGMDISKNIIPELEIHGEYIYNYDTNLNSINQSGELIEEKGESSSYLIGMKYLLKTNTSIVLEYFYDGKRLEKVDYDNVYNNYKDDYTKAFNTYKKFVKNPMQKYLYLKVSQPEPLNLLYSNISYTNIYNLLDNSNSSKVHFSYEPYNNMNYYVDFFGLIGEESTEFGDKLNIGSEVGVKIIF